MRRLLFVATGAFFVITTLLPMQRSFVVRAVSDGERLAMYSKPAVVRIIDGAAGQMEGSHVGGIVECHASGDSIPPVAAVCGVTCIP